MSRGFHEAKFDPEDVKVRLPDVERMVLRGSEGRRRQQVGSRLTTDAPPSKVTSGS
jgi:hypothetical protein